MTEDRTGADGRPRVTAMENTAPGVNGTVPISASSADLHAARTALDAGAQVDDETDDAAAVTSAVQVRPDMQLSPAIAALMAQTRRAPAAPAPAAPSVHAPRGAGMMMSLDAELAAAMADAEAAVSGPGPARAVRPRPAQPQPAAEMDTPGLDPDLLGALEAAISGAPTSNPVASHASVSDALGALLATTHGAGHDTTVAVEATAAPAAIGSIEAESQSLFESSMFESGPSPTARDDRATDADGFGGDGDRGDGSEAAGDGALDAADNHDAAGSGARLSDEGAAERSGDAEATLEAERQAEAAQLQGARDEALLDGLAAWMRLIKVCAAPRADREMAAGVARTTLARLHGAGGAWSAEVRGHGWFVDDRWLPAPAHHAATLAELVAALRRAGNAGVWVSGDATAEQLLAVTQRFVRAVRGKATEEDGAAGTVNAVGFTQRPALQPNAESWVAGVVRRCVAFADDALNSPRFPEAAALALLDELSQAVPAHTAAVMRAIELRGATWTSPWGAASTAALALATLSAVGASPRVSRATALAMWALTLSVHRGETPPALTALAARAAARMPPLAADTAWSPVAAGARGLLLRLSHPQTSPRGIPALATLLYALHRTRLTESGGLLAAVVAHPRDPTAPEWSTALLAAIGPIPVGTAVALPDGTRGLVVDLAGDAGPLRPLVQVGRAMVRPAADVVVLRDAR